MWIYRCPVCKERITEKDMNIKKVEKIKGCAHKCPKCGNLLYVTQRATCLDLADMIINIVKDQAGFILSREQAVVGYREGDREFF